MSMPSDKCTKIQRYYCVGPRGVMKPGAVLGGYYKASDIDPLLQECREALAAEQRVLQQLADAYHSQQAFQCHLRMAALLARLTAVLGETHD